jgi:hypothetical protein
MLGIGANVVVFGVLNAILLHPLEVKEPQSLFQIRHKPWMTGRLLTTSYPAFADFRRRNTTFSAMAGIYGYSHAKLSWQNTVLSISGDEVTGDYFDFARGCSQRQDASSVRPTNMARIQCRTWSAPSWI